MPGTELRSQEWHRDHYCALMAHEDRRMREYLADVLLSAHPRLWIATAGSPDLVTQRARTLRPDLLVLNSRNGRFPACELCRNLRHDPTAAEISIIALTPSNDLTDRASLLLSGADAVISVDEIPTLLAPHVSALLRRIGPRRRGTYRRGCMTLVRSTQSVLVDGDEIPLGEIQFELLSVLAREPVTVMTSAELRTVLLRSTGHDMSAAALRRNVLRTRRKLGHHAWLVHTVAGRGYCLGGPHVASEGG